MKKGIVVVLAILLAVGAGFITPILMNWDSDGSARPTAGSATPSIKTPAAATNSNKTVNPEDVVPLATTTPRYESDIKLGTPSPDSLSKNADNASPTPSKLDNKEPSAKPTKSKESEDWVDRKIREHRDEIDDGDLEDFRRIYSMVNIVYIQSIINDGLDDEGTTKLKSYLRNTLGGDYERAKELFYKYSYLLSEV